ncbi:pyridine nucleotide-disulfide oxidoreductase [marine bacterium AO1-C]|nr:pyridine nucleotide-disulfide oxidoreductase [marine bacterium AO1-C]
MNNQQKFDAIIIGGSYAGLSAAMALGRSMRNTLVIDNGKPCNRQTPHSHNFLTQDGQTPKEIATLGKVQVEQYPTVSFHEGLAMKGAKTQEGFEITTQSGKVFTGKKLVFATGIADQMPDIEGFAECWGISVIHCPYCHGYEYRKQKTALMANGERAFHMIPLIYNLSNELTVLTQGKADFSEEQREKLKARNVEIIEKEITIVEHQKGHIGGVIFKDGTKLKLDAMYAAIPFTQHTDIPQNLGCEMTEFGYIEVDSFQKTNIPGVYACGDNATMMRSVANAVYQGSVAGAALNGELAHETF